MLYSATLYEREAFVWAKRRSIKSFELTTKLALCYFFYFNSCKQKRQRGGSGGRTKAAAEHAHDGALLHDSQVGEQSQLEPSSHGKAAHSCDQRLGQLQAGRTLEEMCTIEKKKKVLTCMLCIVSKLLEMPDLEQKFTLWDVQSECK